MNKIKFCPSATALIRGGEENPKLCGRVNFYELPHSILIEANINGLPNSDSGFFGFHIHEGASCSGANFANTKSHYNPKNRPHPAHSGDMPPLILCNGGAYLSFKTDRFCVKDIIGKTVVIHSMPDDFHTEPAVNAGTKIACGVIHRV